jgi:hypothetical protein
VGLGKERLQTDLWERNQIPKGDLGRKIRLKKPEGELLPYSLTFGLKCANIILRN